MPDNATHVAVKHTSLRLVGELSEWINFHPQYLEKILNWLLAGLNSPKVSSEAANSLQNICCSCKSHMSHHLDTLIHILDSLDNFNLKVPAANGLLKGVAILLIDLPHQRITEYMWKLCQQQINPLYEAVRKSEQNPDAIVRNSSTDPVLYLDRLATIFRHVTPRIPENVQHPCLPVAIESWNVLKEIGTKFVSDIRIMERYCRTLRFAIRNVRTQALPILNPLIEQMTGIYQSHPHSVFLYLGSILVDEFYVVPAATPELLSMLVKFLDRTFQLLQAENGLRDHPDTVDDFFRLNARFIQRLTLPYLNSGDHVVKIIDCGLSAIKLEHRDANASVMKFFLDLLHCGRSKEDRPDYKERHQLVVKLKDDLFLGEKLVHNLLHAVVCTLPSYTYFDAGDILYELMCFDRVKVCGWLKSAVESLPTKNEKTGTEIVTRQQLVGFYNQVTKAEEPRQVAEAIREFCRLWR